MIELLRSALWCIKGRAGRLANPYEGEALTTLANDVDDFFAKRTDDPAWLGECIDEGLDNFGSDPDDLPFNKYRGTKEALFLCRALRMIWHLGTNQGHFFHDSNFKTMMDRRRADLDTAASIFKSIGQCLDRCDEVYEDRLRRASEVPQGLEREFSGTIY